ncbi:amidohydrolase [Cetobacterium somerae]|uniref:amidohydrolase n=1 Tax=Cetobacterium sp. NK01 TaxID=2993530 RepID=UPI002116AA4D|nr:amidohydrolase [Cetobacterium sp. NK01]MCQ8213684.1 amidohydrolase [Cetobacterium sp. NK01]
MITDNKILKLAEKYQDYMIQMRRKFHENPELSGEEFKTKEILIEEFKSMGVPYKELPGTGLIAIIKGNHPGKHVVLRADMDALPVLEEENNLIQKKVCISLIKGLSHACGHDAHMAILLGSMKVLKDMQEDLKGTVYCCFEEGEETNCGVDAMLEALKEYPIDSCFALHVYSALESGKINIEPGPRMAGTVGIGFYVRGKAGHGSRPDLAVNPIIPAAHIVTQIDSAFVNQINAEETVTLGISVFQGGQATNIIPNEVFIGGTARFFKKEEGEKALKIINTIASNTAICHRSTIEFAERNKISLYPVINDMKCALDIQNKIKEICGDDVHKECSKWYASECYGKYLDKYPGALGFLGINNTELGTGAEHHNGRFDIDESSFILGVCAEVGYVFCD